MRLRPLCLTALLLAPLPGLAETHTVRMLNRSETGAMAYDPDHLTIAPGDTVRFVASNPGHNAATIEEMLPEGATPFIGRINEEIDVTFSQPGTYGVKCSPHFGMGMVMLIQVGDTPASDADLPDGLPPRAEARFRDILDRMEIKSAAN